MFANNYKTRRLIFKSEFHFLKRIKHSNLAHERFSMMPTKEDKNV